MAARTQSKVAHGLRVVLTLFKLIAGSWAARSHELLRARLTQVRQVQQSKWISFCVRVGVNSHFTSNKVYLG